jgi:hypothetical protein
LKSDCKRTGTVFKYDMQSERKQAVFCHGDRRSEVEWFWGGRMTDGGEGETTAEDDDTNKSFLHSQYARRPAPFLCARDPFL